MRMFLEELGVQREKYVLNCDRQSAIHLAKNTPFHSKTKHIDVRYHWIHQVLDDGLLQLEKMHTEGNPTNILNFFFPRDKHEISRTLVGLMQM